MVMDNTFLKNYSIPIIKNTDAADITTKEDEMPEEEKIPNVNYNSNRFIPPGKYGTDFVPSSMNNLKRKLNTPKTTTDGKLVIFQGRDESYPYELNMLIHPFECELCLVKINSPSSARDHYESKCHDRKIRSWLAKTYTEKGLEAPVVKRSVPSSRVELSINAPILHCDVCDLKLSSFIHAKQHYGGRKHQLAAQKLSKPSGAGYYNKEGKWVRQTTVNDNKFGIGDAFNNDLVVDKAAVSVSSQQQHQVDPALFCQVCQISVTSAGSLDAHLKGAKHKKMLLQMVAKSAIIPTANDSNSILSSLTADENKKGSTDLYRTPMGAYYCQICNLNMTHEAVLKQHLEGRKHLKKSAEEKAKLLLVECKMEIDND